MDVIIVFHEEFLLVLGDIQHYAHSSSMIGDLSSVGVPQIVSGIMASVPVDVLKHQCSIWSFAVPVGRLELRGFRVGYHSEPRLNCHELVPISDLLFFEEVPFSSGLDLVIDAVLDHLFLFGSVLYLFGVALCLQILIAIRGSRLARAKIHA